MKYRTNLLKRNSARNAALLLVFSLTTATLLAKGPANKKAQPEAKDHKYKIASGADQVLSSVYDPSTNSIRVSGGGSGGGTVTNVGLSMPSTFSVTGGPVTSSGTLSVNWAQPVGIANGGTGQTSAASAFNALAPPTATGGLIYGTGPNTYGNLAPGSNGQCLGSNGSTLVWTVCGSGSTLTLGGDLNGTSASQTVIGLQGHSVSASAPAGGQVLEWNSAANAWTPSALPAFGTVSSVGLAMPSIFNLTGSPITNSGTLSVTLAPQASNTFLAGPASGAAGAPSFRALAGLDIPSINLASTGNGGVTGTLKVANGGTGLVSVGSNGQCLASNGTALVWNSCGTGTVTSVGLTLPSGFGTSGSPVTASGTLGLSMPAGWGAGSLLVGNGANSVATLPVGTNGQCLTMSGAAVAWGSCGTSGSSATFQVNGANTGSQSAINFQNGGYITVTNPSVGNIQFNFTGPLAVANGGTGTATPSLAAGPNISVTGSWPNQTVGFTGILPFAEGGTGLSTLGSAGQCLQVNSGATALQYGPCGSGSGSGTVTSVGFAAPSGFNVTSSPVGTSGTLTLGMPSSWNNGSLLVGNGANSVSALGIGASGQCLTSTGATEVWGSCGGSALPAGWSQNGSTGAILAQPLSNQDAVPLTVASSFSSGGTADLFDVCQTSPCSPANKFFWVTWNGNLGFQASNIQLAGTGAAPYLYLNGINGNPGQPYLKMATAELNMPSCAVSTNATGGTIAAGTYYFKCTWVNPAGETYTSPENSVTTTGSTSTITVTAPGAQYSAFGYQIYESTTPGSETLSVPAASICTLSSQIFDGRAVCAPNANATFTSAPSGSSVTPPSTNTTGGAFISAWAPSADGLGLFLTGGAPNADAPVDAGLALPGGTGVNLTSGATTTTGNLACLSASNTVSQCGANAASTIIGVFAGSGQNALVQTTGITTVNLASPTATKYNDYACSSATAGAIVDNGTTPCASGQQVGIIAQSNLTAVLAVPVFLRFAGSSSGSGTGSSSTFQVNGSNLSSSSTVNWIAGGPITVTNPATGNVQFNCATCLIQNPTTTAQNTITGQNATSIPLLISGFGSTGGNAFEVDNNGYQSIYVNAFGDLIGGKDIQSNGNVEVDANSTGAQLLFGANKDMIIFSGGATGNGDIRGQLAITSATSKSFTFPLAYGSAPVCTLTPTSNPGSLTWWVTTTNTAVTANLSASGTLTFNYICVGNPN